VQDAKAKVATFNLGEYTTRSVGTFWVTEAVASRGEIEEEQAAQDLCWDAMEMDKGSAGKLKTVLRALETFPISTEAWGMLGHFYLYELTKHEDKQEKCATAAIEMYDNAIKCARLLNPTWNEDRTDELIWGEIEHRPYLRSLHGRGVALKEVGRRKEAIAQAKKLLRLNPSDNQGVRKELCSWYLDAGDTEACTNLMRKFGDTFDTFLAYSDVLLQYSRWQKDDATENEVRETLYSALQQNIYVPDLLGQDVQFDNECYSPGDIREARYYVAESKKLWAKHRHPEVIQWIKAQKYSGGPLKPSEEDLITLLKCGVTFQVRCSSTDLDGRDRRESYLVGTQRRGKCFGCRTDDFHWPRELNRPHQVGSPILIHNNVFDDDKKWRKTLYTDIIEVPYWNLFLHYHDEVDEEADEVYTAQYKTRRAIEPTECFVVPNALTCEKCNSPEARFCALDNDRPHFYCSKVCMKDFLVEVDPIFLDLKSQTLKINASSECSIKVIRLNDALRIAIEHMPNLNSVDIFINQTYVLNEALNAGDIGKKLLLAPSVLYEFSEKMKTKLVSVSFRLDECCWEELKEMTDRCKALVSLGTMPLLRKLDLTNFGSDDIESLTSCLSPGLHSLCLNYVMISKEREWSATDVDSFVSKLTQLKSLVSLSLENTRIKDRHLAALLPKLKFLRCLNLSGAFGWAGDLDGHRQLTDAGMQAIADNLPHLLNLTVDYQHNITIRGIRALIEGCQDLVELEVCGFPFDGQQVSEIIASAKKLLFLRIDTDGQAQSLRRIHDAVVKTSGRVVVCSSQGLVKNVSLSSEQSKTQQESIAKVEKAHEQAFA
jgi:tetratricopeptide (TPR) repeat protein